MHLLRQFFQTGRKPNGSYMGETENVVNAVERNLSCLRDDEIIALRAQAFEFVAYCTDTLKGREVVEPRPPNATLKMELKADSGFESESEHRITGEQWTKVLRILHEDL
jgi:hypothetical protein